MQVKELIKRLEKFREDLEVEIETDCDAYTEFTFEEAFGSVIIKTF